MVKKIFIVGLVSVSLLACGTSESTEGKVTRTEHIGGNDDVVDQRSQVTPNRMLTVDVEGMSCVKGCGSAIRAELYATGGVSNCDFDFEEDRAVDVAMIEFDKDIVSADELLKVLAETDNGKFTIGKSTSKELENTTPVKESTKTKSKKDVEIAKVTSSVGFRMPNIFDLFSGLI